MTRVEETQIKIEQMIQNGEYNSENYLPSEGELVTRFGVSRVTVREAVRTLEIRGFLKRIHGKGLMVLDNSINVMSQSLTDMISQGNCTPENLMEVRQIIEEACARSAASKATQEDLDVMESCLHAMDTATVMDESYHRHDLAFHLQLAKASKNNLLIAIVQSYTPLLLESIVQASQMDYTIEIRDHFHRNVYDCILLKDPDGAAHAMRLHLVATRKNQELFRPTL